MLVLPVSVRRRLRGGKGVSVCGGVPGAFLPSVSPPGSPAGAWGRAGGPGVRGADRSGPPGDGAHRPASLPMRPAASIPPLAGADGSLLSPCKAGGPVPRMSAPPGASSAALTAACGSSDAITVHMRVFGLVCGRGRGLNARAGVMGTAGGDGPGGVLVIVRCGGWRTVGGARVDADTWARGYGLCRGVGLGSLVAAVTRHLLDVGRHWGQVGGGGCHCLSLMYLRPGGRGGGGLWAFGAGLGWSWDEVRRASAIARSAMKVVEASSYWGAVLDAAVARHLVAGAGGHRGRPQGAEFALPAWRRACASAWVWQQLAAVAWRRVWVAASWRWAFVVASFWVSAWRRVCVSAWLQMRASLGCTAAPLCR